MQEAWVPGAGASAPGVVSCAQSQRKHAPKLRSAADRKPARRRQGALPLACPRPRPLRPPAPRAPRARPAAIAQRLQLCFAPGTPGSKLTEAQLRESALRPTPAQPPQAPGAAAPTPGAAAGAGGAAPAAPAAAADSPPGAHDSASSHQLMGGTALASRKRALGGGGGAVAPEREPLLKPAPQAHGQGQQQQQPADGATSAEAAAKRVRA